MPPGHCFTTAQIHLQEKTSHGDWCWCFFHQTGKPAIIKCAPKFPGVQYLRVLVPAAMWQFSKWQSAEQLFFCLHSSQAVSALAGWALCPDAPQPSWCRSWYPHSTQLRQPFHNSARQKQDGGQAGPGVKDKWACKRDALLSTDTARGMACYQNTFGSRHPAQQHA